MLSTEHQYGWRDITLDIHVMRDERLEGLFETERRSSELHDKEMRLLEVLHITSFFVMSKELQKADEQEITLYGNNVFNIDINRLIF